MHIRPEIRITGILLWRHVPQKQLPKRHKSTEEKNNNDAIICHKIDAIS